MGIHTESTVLNFPCCGLDVGCRCTPDLIISKAFAPSFEHGRYHQSSKGFLAPGRNSGDRWCSLRKVKASHVVYTPFSPIRLTKCTAVHGTCSSLFLCVLVVCFQLTFGSFLSFCGKCRWSTIALPIVHISNLWENLFLACVFVSYFRNRVVAVAFLDLCIHHGCHLEISLQFIPNFCRFNVSLQSNGGVLAWMCQMKILPYSPEDSTWKF